jgi:hypothetical protein
VRQIDEVLEYLKAGARRYGSTRTEGFVQALRALPEVQRAAYGEFIVDLNG